MHLYGAMIARSLGVAIGLTLLLVMWGGATETSPSIGLTYSRLDLDRSLDNASVAQGFNLQSYVADLRLPLTTALELTLSAGWSQLIFDSWNQTFQLQTVVQGTGGNIYGTYGHAGASLRRDVLVGYNTSVSARWYFGGKP